MNRSHEIAPADSPLTGAASERLATVDRGAIFPLPLVPFERYMLADDRPGYPMTFFYRVEFEGVPDRGAMNAAFAEALERHPLLMARVVRRGIRWYWTPIEGPPPRLAWHLGDPEPAWPVGEPIDIRRGCGVHGYVHASVRNSSLVVSFHHAACDGIGATRFVGDVLACYGRRTASADRLPVLLPLSAANLRYRGLFDLQLPEPVSRWVALKSLLREFWKVVARRPQVLRNKNRPPATSRGGRPALSVATLDQDAYRRFCTRASQQQVTANDLLLRDMFLTARHWNATNGGDNSRGWLRINMPTSLRGKRDTRMPAANTLGYALLTHHTDECDDPQRLLHSIAADTLAIRTWSLGAIFVQALQVTSRIPGLIPFGARVGRRFSTLVVSNLGDPSRRFRARFPRCQGQLQVGNLKVQRMFGAPPIRPGTRVALALFSYKDRLVMALHSDPRWFSAEDARQFLALYQARLERTAESSNEV